MSMIFVGKIIHLATKIFGSTNFNHSTAELFISYKSVMDTLEELLFALLLERCSISCLLASSRNGARAVALSLYSGQEWKRDPWCTGQISDFFCSVSQEVPARAIDDADVPA